MGQKDVSEYELLLGPGDGERLLVSQPRLLPVLGGHSVQ